MRAFVCCVVCDLFDDPTNKSQLIYVRGDKTPFFKDSNVRWTKYFDCGSVRQICLLTQLVNLVIYLCLTEICLLIELVNLIISLCFDVL